MHTDIDFYERKISRLQADIATLHEELNMARGRLRSAEDYQIKYQLLLRQSNHENARLKKMEEAERQKFSKLLVEELEKAERIWTQKMQEFEQQIIDQEAQEKEELRKQISSLKKKIVQMSTKCEQVDALVFKNKKIITELKSLEEIIEENKILNEKSREEELRSCKENMRKKYEERMEKDRVYYEEKIRELQSENERMSNELFSESIKIGRSEKRSPVVEKQGSSVVPEEIAKLEKLFHEKNTEIQKILRQKIEFEESLLKEQKELKAFIQELEEKIFNLSKDHEVELYNLKARMEKSREQQIEQLQKKNSYVEKEHLKEKEQHIQQLTQDVVDLHQAQERLEKENKKLSKQKVKLSEKIAELNTRLRDFDHDRELGETEMLITSLKNTQGREDQMSSYENGINFLERQLRKSAIKIDKKNDEVKELISDITRIRNECDEEVAEMREKYYHDLDEAERKISRLEDEVRNLNEEVRNRENQKREIESDFTKTLSQLKAELRGLRNLNADLQRDYNRILESKKNLDKSFREERERSVTSKSEIANTKKQKWLQLERQKNQIELIFKSKEEQLKTEFNLQIDELRVERDELKKVVEMLRTELAAKPQPVFNNEKEKENVYSEYHKKLATINLEIALTENLYNTLKQAKSRVVGEKEEPKQPSSMVEIAEEESVREESNRQSSARFIDTEKEYRDLIPGSDNSLEQIKKDFEFDSPENEVDFGASSGGQTPDFNMLQSFNPRFG